MTNIIVVTSIKEREDVVAFLLEKLKSIYYTDLSVDILHSAINKIDVYQRVKTERHLMISYKVIFVSVFMDLDQLKGHSHLDNVNINRLISKLDKMKTEAIRFVNTLKVPSAATVQRKKAFERAARSLFD